MIKAIIVIPFQQKLQDAGNVMLRRLQIKDDTFERDAVHFLYFRQKKSRYNLYITLRDIFTRGAQPRVKQRPGTAVFRNAMIYCNRVVWIITESVP